MAYALQHPCLARHAPIWINLAAETVDEYAPMDKYELEAGMILARRRKVRYF